MKLAREVDPTGTVHLPSSVVKLYILCRKLSSNLILSYKLIEQTVAGERTFGVLTKLDLMDKGTNALDVSIFSVCLYPLVFW